MTAYPSNSLTATGSVTSAGAGATIASITAPPDGIYTVLVTIALTGTAETALRNLRLRENGATVADNLPSIPTASLGGPLTLVFDQVEVNQGGGNLDVIAIAGAVAGSIYNVVLQATRVV